MQFDQVRCMAVITLLLALCLTINAASAEAIFLVCQRQPGNPGPPFHVTVDFASKTIDVDGSVGQATLTDAMITARLPVPGDPLGHQDISIDRVTGLYSGRACRSGQCSGTGYAECRKGTKIL
jgi:hypothetical protein